MTRNGRQRGFSTLGTVVLSALAALIVAPLLMGWVIVDVDAEDARFKVPLPLGIARAAAWMMPAEDVAISVPADVRRHREAVISALAELEACPDATLLTVTSRDADVRVAKENGMLVVHVVDEDGDAVDIRLPVAAARRALERWDWQTFHPRMAVDLLGACRGDIVNVRSRDAHVRIARW